MKKVFITLFTMFVMLFSNCKKQDETLHISNNYNSEIKTNILIWLNNQKQSQKFVDTLKQLLQWDNIQKSKINHKESLIYIPIKYNYKQTGLTLILDNVSNTFEKVYISEINYFDKIEPKQKNISTCQLLSNIYNSNMHEFSGTIAAYNIEKKFLWELGYENGINLYTKK